MEEKAKCSFNESLYLIKMKIVEDWAIRRRGDTDRFFFSSGISLLCLTIPVAFGVYVNYRFPKQSKIILKVSSCTGQLVQSQTQRLGRQT